MIIAMKKTKKNPLRLFLIGFSMGSADIVPGVSGGTIAFIFGVYEKLINSIKHFSGKFLKQILRGKVQKAFKEAPFSFLVPLGLGILTAVVTFANVLSNLLHDYPIFVWSFFLGLIIASIYIVGKKVTAWGSAVLAFLLAFSIFSYFLVGAVPVETPDTAIAMLLAGAIAICAMILPGISGSFLLIFMGKYEQVLHAVVTRDFLKLGIFMLGAVVGLALFSRVLSYLFKNYHDIVVASLTGIMIGSIRKVWPYKETLTTRVNSHGELVPLLQKNVLPEMFSQTEIISIGLFLLALVVMFLVQRIEQNEHDMRDGNIFVRLKNKLLKRFHS